MNNKIDCFFMRRTLLTAFVLALVVTINAQNKPYITKIYDFVPAPGQFINNTPYVEEPVSKDSILTLVAECICGYEKSNGKVVVADALISLGSFGGYVVFGFDHPVVNVVGEYDLQIFGNGFQAQGSSTAGGSSEPGIVMVSRDVNGNGIPDDPWYELAGSEYYNPRTQHHFTITYYKPDEDKVPVPGTGSIIDAEYIRWTCNSVDSLQEGYVSKNSFHRQSYWPQWVEGETLTFEGTKLPCNAANEGTGNTEYWVQRFYDWGYVDNRTDWSYGYTYDDPAGYETANKGFKLDWAVNDDGTPKELKKIDFVKVYCAVLQQCGWLGETSTEVCGAIDLHPDAVAAAEPGDVNGDGNVTAADITALYNYLLNSDETYLSTSDVNGDGNITSGDITAIYNILLD